MTPFNRPITQHRRVAFRSLSLDSVKAIKSAFGFSVNDVVLALRAGALRRWLADHHALPEAPLITMIPVSIRDPASRGALGNKVSAMLAMLPTNIADPAERLVAAHAATELAKSQQATAMLGPFSKPSHAWLSRTQYRRRLRQVRRCLFQAP